jgi:hypothetical protein
MQIVIEPTKTRITLKESKMTKGYQQGNVTLIYELVRAGIHRRLRKGDLVAIEVRGKN